MSNTNTPVQAITSPLAVIKQAIAVCFVETLNLVPVIWGPVGWTKSSTIASLAADLGLPLHDVRLSDKEPTDLGGIPYPVDQEGPDGKIRKVLSYLANSLLPWADIYGDEYECVLFFDEVDRGSIDVLNAALQILLDRGINGRKLSRLTHIVCAGNGVTDTGTTELTSAAATRLVHFYVDTTGPKALDHWVDWAHATGKDPALVGYARFRPEIFGGAKHQYIEQQKPNPRTFTWAAAALDVLDKTNLAPEVGDSIVFGLVGQAAGREYIAYRANLSKCPSFEKVVADPMTAPLPPADQIGILYALGEAFAHRLTDPARAEQGLSPEIDPAQTEAIATYFHRNVTENPGCREAVAWWFRVAGAKIPSLAGLPVYKQIVA